MKNDINTILITNWYLTMCKLETGSKNSTKKDIIRKYLNFKIGKILSERTIKRKKLYLLIKLDRRTFYCSINYRTINW